MIGVRPRPQVSELTAEFWAAASRHELVRPVCSECAASFFTPQIACPRCLSEHWVYERSSGRGVIYSATTVHRAPFAGFETPYALAIIDLEENWAMLANVAGEEVGVAPAIGTPVEVGWATLDDEIELPIFRVAR